MLFLSFPGAQGLTLGFQGMHKTPGLCSSLSGIGAAAVARLKRISPSPLAVKNGHLLPFIAGANDSHHLGGLAGIEGQEFDLMKQRLGSESASSCQRQRKDEEERKAPDGSRREKRGSQMPKHLSPRCRRRCPDRARKCPLCRGPGAVGPPLRAKQSPESRGRRAGVQVSLGIPVRAPGAAWEGRGARGREQSCGWPRGKGGAACPGRKTNYTLPASQPGVCPLLWRQFCLFALFFGGWGSGASPRWVNLSDCCCGQRVRHHLPPQPSPAPSSSSPPQQRRSVPVSRSADPTGNGRAD